MLIEQYFNTTRILHSFWLVHCIHSFLSVEYNHYFILVSLSVNINESKGRLNEYSKGLFLGFAVVTYKLSGLHNCGKLDMLDVKLDVFGFILA